MGLTLPFRDCVVVISNESPFDDPAVNDTYPPAPESFLGDSNCRASSRHRVVVKHGDTLLASRVLLANGGASGVHAHSAFIRGDRCFVAVGPFVCALKLPSLAVVWHTEADSATCFGVYDSPTYASIISRGEIEIARLTYDGEIIWSGSGRDIFSEGFQLFEHHVEAVDFYGARYRFELATGESRIIGE